MTGAAVGSVARVLVEALYPLRDAMRSPAAFGQLLRDLGHGGSVTEEALAALPSAATIADLVDEGVALVDQFDALDDGDPDLGAVILDLVELGTALLAAVDDLRHIDGAALGGELADPALWLDLAQELPGHLLVTYLEAEVPVLYGLLRFTGVISDVDTATGEIREVLDLDQLGRVAADPVGGIRDRYGWGGAQFAHERLIEELALALETLGLTARTAPVRDSYAQRFFDGGATDGVSELVLPLLTGPTEAGWVETGLALIPVPSRPNRAVDELYLTNVHIGAITPDVEIAPGWRLRSGDGLDETGLLGLRLGPDGSTVEDEPPVGIATWTITAEPDEPWRPLGGLLEVGGLDLEVVAGPVEDPELRLALRLRDAAVMLAPGDGDAFLRYLVGTQPLRITMAPELAWSSRDGLTVSGSAGLDVVLPVSLRIGPVLVDGVHLVLRGEDATARVQADVGVTGELGPFVATVQGIGVALDLARAQSSTGSLGALDVTVRFVPPAGIGFAIVSDVASGGGYVESDPDAGRYAGVLDVDLLGVGLTAVGILSTPLPDGDDGWALFFSLSATFTGLQLGFGFTLNGVGGLIGVHRGLDAAALGEAVRSGALDSLLFPDDPVADAASIIRDIDSVFPVQEGQYVFGPVAKIGWGTPTLVELDLGVVVEVPDEPTISLLGSLSAVLPDEDAAVLSLNVDVAGTLDPSAGTISVNASLRDSQVAGIALAGDMAVRAELLTNPALLLSFGGFNPHFDAPGSFPDLDRLSVSLDTGDNLRLGLWGYFAVTSNTVQFGAGGALWATAAGLTVEGHLDFDALIQFDPFRFLVELGFGVDVRAGAVELFGVHLDVMLQGPNPFHVVGSASMKILGVRTSFYVDEIIGRREEDDAPETVDATSLLIAAIENPAAWREVSPSGGTGAVVLTDGGGEDGLRLHPAGGLEVVQRVVPLRRTLERYGTARLGDLNQFELLEPTIGGQSAAGVEDVSDWFAPAQYHHLTDEERISAPSFELMPAGLRFVGTGVAAGPAAPFVLEYEQIIRDPDLSEVEARPDRTYVPPQQTLQTAQRHSMMARRRIAGASRPVALKTAQFGWLGGGGGPERQYGLRPTSWVVADTRSGEVDPSVERMSWSQARTAMLASGRDGLALAPGHEISAVTA